MRLYSEYIEIDPNFIDIFTEEADQNYPSLWTNFIPHQSFKEIFSKLIESLERGKAIDKKSIWIQGSYGTGKTYTSFFLKHLLEDDISKIEDYISQYPELTDYWIRLKSLREQGDYIIIYKSGSSHVDSANKLLVEIQQSIKKGLLKKGYVDCSDPTIFDFILNKLENPDSTFDWKKAFIKYKEKFIQFNSPQDVVAALHSSDIDLDLIDRLKEVLENENIFYIGDVETVKEWIKQIILKNNLQGILIIWDEFSDFFSVNQSTDVIQELAHLTTETPFYLFLITHKTSELIFRDDKITQYKINQRFHLFHFKMEPITAYQLMRSLIKINLDLKEEWESLKEETWKNVESSIGTIYDDKVKKKDFKELIPIHPYSAFILAKIADQLSSAQRTLFKFFKKPDSFSFYEFIKTHPKDNTFLMSLDYIWDYFLQGNQFEMSATKFQDIYSYYYSRIDNIKNKEEQSIFKAILLLYGLSILTPGDPKLRPSKKNIFMAYSGVYSTDVIKSNIESLKTNDYIREIPAGHDYEYTIQIRSIDEKRLNEIKKTLFPFKKEIITPGEIGKKLISTLQLGSTSTALRIKTDIISFEDFKDLKDKKSTKLLPYQIQINFIIPFDSSQLSDLEKLISDIPNEDRCSNLVVQYPFEQWRWEKWEDYNANLKYYKENHDTKNEIYYQVELDRLISDYLENIKTSGFLIHDKPHNRRISGKSGYEIFINELIGTVFIYGPEKISQINTLFGKQIGPEAIRIGIGLKENPKNPYKDLMETLLKSPILLEVEVALKKIKELFSKNPDICLNEIWDELQSPPFGYSPVPICGVLFGFIMREYSSGDYYFRDGVNSFHVSPNSMVDYIHEIMKGGKNEIFISKRTIESEEFCNQIQLLFGFPKGKIQDPIFAFQEIGKYLKNNVGYPLWALIHTFSKEKENEVPLLTISELDSSVKSTFQKNTEFLSSNKLIELNELLKQSFPDLILRLKISNFEDGMKKFIQEINPEIIDLLPKLKFDFSDLMNNLKDLMMEEIYLWDESKVKLQITKLYPQLNMVYGISLFTGTAQKDLNKAKNDFKAYYQKNSKLPLFVIADNRELETKKSLLDLNLFLNDENNNFDEDLPQFLILNNKEISLLIKDQIAPIKTWIFNNFNEDLDIEDVKKILSDINNLSNIENKDEFNEIIIQSLSKLQKRKNGRVLSEIWKNITSSSSPLEWSKHNKLPIQWIIEGEEFQKIFECINKPSEHKIEELESAISYLTRNKQKLNILNDEKEINKKFLFIVAEGYQYLFSSENEINSFKESLIKKVKLEVNVWPTQLSYVKEISKKLIEEIYSKNKLQIISQKLASMTETQLRNMLKDLIKNPRIGLEILHRSNKK
jgi:hypothetical protein